MKWLMRGCGSSLRTGYLGKSMVGYVFAAQEQVLQTGHN